MQFPNLAYPTAICDKFAKSCRIATEKIKFCTIVPRFWGETGKCTNKINNFRDNGVKYVMPAVDLIVR